MKTLRFLFAFVAFLIGVAAVASAESLSATNFSIQQQLSFNGEAKAFSSQSQSYFDWVGKANGWGWFAALGGVSESFLGIHEIGGHGGTAYDLGVSTRWNWAPDQIVNNGVHIKTNSRYNRRRIAMAGLENQAVTNDVFFDSGMKDPGTSLLLLTNSLNETGYSLINLINLSKGGEGWGDYRLYQRNGGSKAMSYVVLTHGLYGLATLWIGEDLFKKAGLREVSFRAEKLDQTGADPADSSYGSAGTVFWLKYTGRF